MRTISKSLLIVGAGPKALAIAAKAAALAHAGYSVPTITIFDPHGVASSWTGTHGFTDGTHPLGTPPEKDVGFPYNSQVFRDGLVDRYVLQNYSWPAFRYLTAPESVHGAATFGEIVDRGGFQHPTHLDWARYLQWVWKQVENLPFLHLIEGRADALRISGERWVLTWRTTEGAISELAGDAVVITGSGPSLEVHPGQVCHPSLFDGKTFWQNLHKLKDFHEDYSIGIIGAGETAASVALALINTVKYPGNIFVLNHQGAIFSRGESFFENQVFTKPEEWNDFGEFGSFGSLEERREFIKRADRGVFSIKSLMEINRFERLSHKKMNVLDIRVTQDETGLGEVLEIIGSDKDMRNPRGKENLMSEIAAKGLTAIPCQYVVVAGGFNVWWFANLLTEQKFVYSILTQQRESLEKGIGRDLSLPYSHLPTPKLHVPMISGLAQGPGFPGLSCLGHLADRILAGYVVARR